MRLTALALAAALVLAGCGNDGSRSGTGAAVIGAALQTVRGAGKDTSVAAPITRAEIDRFGIPLLRVTVPARNFDALLAIRDNKGDVITWTTTDGVTFTFRQGILIETRGLGSDLMSSSAPSPGRIVRTGQPYARTYFVSGDNDTSDRLSYQCTTTALGTEVIDVVGRSHRTQHLREVCQRAEGQRTNDYWIEGGLPRKSRQWVSPGIGYAEFSRVTN